MDSGNSSLSDSDRLRIGRLIFDGAEPADIAKLYGLAIEEVDAAWEFCRAELSKHFAMVNGESFCLLSNTELASRRLDTVRLLLDWRQALLDHDRICCFSDQSDSD